MSVVVRSHALGIRFLFDHERRVVTPTLARLRRRGDEAWGLKNVDLEIHSGQGVALLGPSGSGKTSLLRLLAGIYTPDAGRLEVVGRVASLLSINAGLLGLLTGRENAMLLSVLAGQSRSEARAGLDDVRDRSGLEGQFERPVSSYSQGMRARLGFAVADRAEPNVLLLDEVHEALDHEFREVVRRRAAEIVAAGGIGGAAPHPHALLATLCERAIFLRHGVVQEDGPFEAVQRAYLAHPESS